MAAQKHQPCAVFAANRTFALVGSRLPLMGHLRGQGWRVVAVADADDSRPLLERAGIEFMSLPFARNVQPWADFQAWRRLRTLYRELRPTLIQHFNAKPVLLGTAAARGLKNVTIVNAITGLGHAFIAGRLTRLLAAQAYRRLLPYSTAVVFQNPDDERLFVDSGWAPAARSRLIRGSGADPRRFTPRRAPSDSASPRVLMAARLIWQKGVREYIEAARTVRQWFPEAQFELAGEWDEVHPDAVDPFFIDRAVADGTLRFHGFVSDMPRLLQEVDLVVLPSYREGVPRVLLEAGACGLATVASDAPGCREAVRAGETGLLVPPRDVPALAAAIAELLADPQRRAALGASAREWIAAEFDVERVAAQFVELYRACGLPLAPWEDSACPRAA